MIMAVFEYKALNASGKKLSGIVDADSVWGARSRLREQRLYPVSLSPVRPVTDGKGNTGRIRFDLFSRVSRIKSTDVALATRLLATLLSAGFPLVRAVATVAGQTRSRALQLALSRIRDAIEGGSSFADALRMYPAAFSAVYINMVAAGESSGTLEVVLERLADFTESREETRKKLQAALAYPAIMAAVGILVLAILLIYIVPGIIQIFADLNQALPLPTKILVRVSGFFSHFWWLLFLGPVVLVLAFHGVRKTDKGVFVNRSGCHPSSCGGPIDPKNYCRPFFKNSGSLLENGVPLLTALAIAQKVAGNRKVSDLIGRASGQVEQGGGAGNRFVRQPEFSGTGFKDDPGGRTKR